MSSHSGTAGASRAEWASYRRLLAYVRPYRSRLIVGIVFGAVFAGSTLGALPALRELLGRTFDLETAGFGEVAGIAFLLLGFVVLRGIGEYLSKYLILWVGNRVVTDLRIQVFSHLQNLSVAFFDRNKTGEIISRTLNDTAMLEKAVSEILSDLAREPLMLIGAAAYVFWLDWQLALATIVVFPLCLIPITVFGRKVRRAGREGQERLAELLGVMQEAVLGVRVVKAFGMEAHELSRFTVQARSFFGRIMRVVRAMAMIEPIIVLLSAIGLIVALGYAKVNGMQQEAFFTFAIALVIMYAPVKKLSRIHLSVQHSSAAADRIFEILDTENSVRNLPGAPVFPGPVSEVRLEQVGFDYGDGSVLSGVNLVVKAGERIGIVGGSGAGKTTLINLLPRFFDPTRGRVCFNGMDIRDCDVASIRLQIGLVTQETFLFNDTVANNIRYGTASATQAAIEQAARLAHAAEFIEHMPHGYDTHIGERGVRLSGGQRQRLAIARAMLRNPPILILDEATSALDTEAERVVQAAIDEVMAGRTVFAIAHRLSTIAHFDRLIVLDKGRIVELGSHDELLARGGLYRRLFDLQFDRAGTTGTSG
ncbi:MAG: hypothetical protein A2340_03510 [Lentisphaerae bacterium RIFOXYB12_FULL_60_10]|nr:MAG: hypothetical protein A2269_09200 [Lentisphaerae bacterium RIFOXYA12_FULL_60_10]OGV83852.1 MAG: hypothetical protein A2340_03510 [Lentisphaerae bacterium RIFOXYB12_FULL_60_10]